VALKSNQNLTAVLGVARPQAGGLGPSFTPLDTPRRAPMTLVHPFTAHSDDDEDRGDRGDRGERKEKQEKHKKHKVTSMTRRTIFKNYITNLVTVIQLKKTL
jgi:hypothetical protein